MVEYSLFDWNVHVEFSFNFRPYYAVFCSQGRLNCEDVDVVDLQVAPRVRKQRPFREIVAIRISATNNNWHPEKNIDSIIMIVVLD